MVYEWDAENRLAAVEPASTPQNGDNHRVAHRKALAWMGHSSSEMLDLYYHLHDDDSQQAMQALAESARIGAEKEPSESAAEGALRAQGQSAIERLAQVPEFMELAECLSKVSERAGFEPAVEL